MRNKRRFLLIGVIFQFVDMHLKHGKYIRNYTDHWQYVVVDLRLMDCGLTVRKRKQTLAMIYLTPFYIASLPYPLNNSTSMRKTIYLMVKCDAEIVSTQTQIFKLV